MPDQTQNPFQEMFEDSEQAAQYADGPARFMPGFRDLHRMTMVLLRERAPDNAHVLVHGAGGGLELEAFAQANPDWTFVGVDPAKAMLDQAIIRLGPVAERVQFHLGYIDDAPEGPFDAATSLLTLHFLGRDERRKTVEQIVRRLKPGAPFVAAYVSFPQAASERDIWFDRYTAYAVATGADPEIAASAREAVSQTLPILDPETDLQCLQEAGLKNVTPFYSAFTWRGWVGYAPE